MGNYGQGLSETSTLLCCILLLACGCTIFISVVLMTRRKERFPPGPFALPIIGHLHLLLHLPHQTLAKLSRKYGDLMGLRLGQQRCVVVSSPELAKEFLSTHDKAFANRPPYGFTSILLFGAQNDLFFSSYGTMWRKHRKICTLQLFTAKRLQALEYVRQQEVRALLRRITHLSQGGSRAIDIGKCVSGMSTYVISRLVYSRRRDHRDVEEEGYDDDDLPQLVREMELETAPTLGDFVPWLRCLDVARKRRMLRLHHRIDSVISGILAERKQAMMMPNSVLHDDLLHVLLQRAESSREEDVLTMSEIKSIMLGMLGGSIHTTALTLEWAMAELLKNPHRLSRLQREIDMVLGKKQQIVDSDVSKLSYLRCVVKEVFRLHPIGPLLIPRISSEECKVRNYTIPANTHLLVNVWAIGRDEQVWPNATQFMPERFEGKDIDVKGQHYELIPFGGGRRICLGLPLGLSIVEVTLANLVNTFNWELPAGKTSASMNMDEISGITSKRATRMVAFPKLRE